MTLSAVDAVEGPMAGLGIELSTLSGLIWRYATGREASFDLLVRKWPLLLQG